jgi:AcrR family transcriptional regulator
MPAVAKQTTIASTRRIPTRERILDEAESLIAGKGVYGFTLKDIADPLDVRVPAIYKHYKSRDDVLVALSKRFIDLLSEQFNYPQGSLAQPVKTLERVVRDFARFHMAHPAYVRLSLVDFATPQGGMEYIRLAAGGPFRSNLVSGPLAAMHRRLHDLLQAGRKSGDFRDMAEVDCYRLIKSILLIRLVFPDDLLADGPPSSSTQRAVENMLWDSLFRCIRVDESGS